MNEDAPTTAAGNGQVAGLGVENPKMDNQALPGGRKPLLLKKILTRKPQRVRNVRRK
jgi:hypothetical protein